MISYDDFQKVEMKAGKILSAEKIPNTDKLLKLSVDFGLKIKTEPVAVEPAPVLPVEDNLIREVVEERDVRQIVSGIALYFQEPATLIGRTFMFVTNLEPRQIKGFESNGMILALKTDSAFSLLEIPDAIVPGTKAN